MAFFERWKRPNVERLTQQRDLRSLVEAASHSSPEIRLAARRALLALSGSDVIEELVKGLQQGNSAAVQILGALGDLSVAPKILAALEHPEMSMHQSARAALVALGASAQLKQAFHESASPKAREMALRGLQELQVEGLAGLLSDALEDPDPSVRSLGEFAGAFPRDLDSCDPALKESALRALARRGDPDFETSLLEHLSSAEADLRVLALQGLGAIWCRQGEPTTEVRARLCPLRVDESSQVRCAFCSLLGTLDFERPWLVEALRDSHPMVRNRAAVALGELNALEAVDELVAALANGSWGAARALGTLGDFRATQPLCEALARHEVADVAAQALGELGDPQAIPALEAFLDRWKPRSSPPPGDPSGEELGKRSLARLRTIAQS